MYSNPFFLKRTKGASYGATSFLDYVGRDREIIASALWIFRLCTVRDIPNDIVNTAWGAERAEYRSGGVRFASPMRLLMASMRRGAEFSVSAPSKIRVRSRPTVGPYGSGACRVRNRFSRPSTPDAICTLHFLRP